MSNRVVRSVFLLLGLACCLFIGLTAMQTTNSQAASRHQIGPAEPDASGRIAGTVRGPGGQRVKEHLSVVGTGRLSSGWVGAGSLQTDAAGHYAFDRLPAGTYRVSFRDSAKVYATQYYSQAATAETAAALNINGSASDAIDGQLAAAGSIEGSVLGTVARYGTIGAYTQIGEQWQLVDYSTLDGDMHYAIQGLPPGIYHVCGASGDWYTGSLPVTTASGAALPGAPTSWWQAAVSSPA